MQTIHIEQTTKRYLSTLRYLEHIKKTGKINLLTRSQRNALRSRLFRYMACIKRYLKLGTLSAGLFATSIIDMDAQCQMNRLIPTQTSFSTFLRIQKPAFADIDGDGDFDLVTGNAKGKINTYENIDGFFRPILGLLNPFNAVDVESRAAPSFVDIDNDGDLDAFIGKESGEIIFLRNDGNVFIEIIGVGNPLNDVDVIARSNPTFVDIDNDGDSDAIIGNSNSIRVYKKNEEGVFLEVTGIDNPLDDIGFISNAAPTFADIDKDGDSDLFVGDLYGAIKYFRNDNGTFNEITGSGNLFNDLADGVSAGPAFIDIDNDGDLDVFIGDASEKIRFLRNANNAFSEVIVSDISMHTVDLGSLTAPTFGDLDGDSDEDAFIGLNDGTIRTFINDNGVFNEAVGSNNPFDGIDVGSFAKPVLVDIDGTDSDTDLDLVLGQSDGTISYYKNTNGSFALLQGAADPFLGVDFGSHSAPAFVDFDGDNDKDAFVGFLDGTIHYFRNDEGTFNRMTGSNNPFNGVDVGVFANPSFLLFNASRALVGNDEGTIQEFEKIANQYVLVSDSPFQGIDVGDVSTPTFVLNSNKVIIGSESGKLFAFSDQGVRSTVWNGPFNSNWHGDPNNWEWLKIPEAECDDVHVFGGSVLKVDPTQIAEGRTLTVRNGGQFEVKAAAELNIDPN